MNRIFPINYKLVLSIAIVYLIFFTYISDIKKSSFFSVKIKKKMNPINNF